MSYKKKDIKLIYAVSMLVGTIVGVGMFGLPYVAAQVGFWPMLIYLCGGSVIVITMNLIYGTIIIGSDGKKRFPGYVKDYFGKKWGIIILINSLLGFYGSQLAYLIIGGKFLQGLISPIFPISPFAATIFFFIIGSFLVYKGIKSVSKSEFFMLTFLILMILIFFFVCFGKIKITNFSGYNMDKIFLPYGIVFFSLMGASALPEIKEIFLKGYKKENYSKEGKASFKKTIIYSVIISLVIYIIFIAGVLGVSGKNTSIEAFSGLKSILSNKIIYLGYIFGFLAVFTSFLSIGLTIEKTFTYDCGLKHKKAFILASIIPFILFLAGFNNFLNIIGFVGTITFGIDGCFLFILYFKIKKLGKIDEPIVNDFTSYAVIVMLLAGIILSLKI
ncbi:MAG: aromatic amino acid transport family protein [bacterium]